MSLSNIRMLKPPFRTLLVVGAVICVASGCTQDHVPNNASKTASATASKIDQQVVKRAGKYDAAPKTLLSPSSQWTAEVVTDAGTFPINIDQAAGPIAAANFVFLAKDGFFDGMKVHRIVKDFVMQTGDPKGDGTGGPGYTITDDPVTQPYKRGVVAMANAGPNTGGSQFFIVLSNSVNLPPAYAIFGQVPEAGMKVVDRLTDVETQPASPGAEASQPVKTIRIRRITVSEATQSQ